MSNSIFNNPKVVKIVVAILVKKLGGDVVLTQADFDEIAYTRLLEDSGPEGIKFTNEQRPVN